MAKTLLDGVNEVLKKVKILDNDTGLLTTLTDSARQVFIDSAVQAINETIDELYSPTVSDLPKPKMLKQSTITLVTGERTARLGSSAVTLRQEFNLVDRTNNHTIFILDRGGFRNIINADLEQDDTGLPSVCAIDPTQERQIIFDRAPTAVENGNVYTYYYDRDLELTDKDDEFPFTNQGFRAVVAAASELWKRDQHQEFDASYFNASLARAAVRLDGVTHSNSYAPPRGGVNPTDPMQA